MKAGDDSPSGAAGRLRGLFESHYEQLCRFARRYVSSSAAARDVVQEVFARVWERRRTKPLEEVRRPYLYRAVRNEAVNRRDRAGSRREMLETHVEGSETTARTPAEDFDQRRLRRRLSAAIEELPPRTREVFLLVRRDGLSYREAAEALDISASTVDTQMGRALEKLRASLGDHDG